jgi:hypothetical protein
MLPKESTLKKEFSKRDVQRMRNLITGKTGDRTHVQTGWEKYKQDYKEGDVWEELGKTWTIKNGIKQTVTKMDSIKKLSILPLTCPSCNKHMKVNEFNKSAYRAKGVCLDCVIKEEDRLKLSGNYQNLLEDRKKSDIEVMVKDLEQALEAWYSASENYVNEQGDIENWSGGNKKEAYEQVKKELGKIKNT